MAFYWHSFVGCCLRVWLMTLRVAYNGSLRGINHRLPSFIPTLPLTTSQKTLFSISCSYKQMTHRNVGSMCDLLNGKITTKLSTARKRNEEKWQPWMRFINDNKQSLKKISFCTYTNGGNLFRLELGENVSLITNIFLLLLNNCRENIFEEKIMLSFSYVSEWENKEEFFGTIKSHLCVYYMSEGALASNSCFHWEKCLETFFRPLPRKGSFPMKDFDILQQESTWRDQYTKPH